MRFCRRLIASALIAVLASIGMTAVTAPAAQAANPCNNDFVWELKEKIRDGKYVIKNYRAPYVTCSRIVVKHVDGRRINVQLRIRRDFVDTSKPNTTKYVQILDKRRVQRFLNTNGVRTTDVSVWAGLASKTTMPYRGTTTMTP